MIRLALFWMSSIWLINFDVWWCYCATEGWHFQAQGECTSDRQLLDQQPGLWIAIWHTTLGSSWNHMTCLNIPRQIILYCEKYELHIISSVYLFTRGVTGKFFWGGQIHFSWFFSRHEMLFPGRKFPFWLTQNKFQSFWKVKSKKKKSPLLIFILVTFRHSIFIFPPFLSWFPSFLLHFPFFPASLFPIGQPKFPVISLGALCPPANPPPTC